MFVSFDPLTTRVTHTILGLEQPPASGSYIELPDQDVIDLQCLSVIDGELVQTTIEPIRTASIDAINARAGAIRGLYITDVSGQQMIYLRKEEEARAWLSATSPDLASYPLIAAEVGLTAPTANELAQLWLNLSALWIAVAAALEGMRFAAIAEVTSAASAEACEEAVVAFFSTSEVLT
jgi:hypothetical protein